MKNGSGRFFHLDHGQLFEGFWVDDVAKCGTMIDFGRDEAPEPTQFPIPKVGSTQQGPVVTPRDRKQHPRSHIQSGQAQPSPAREQTRFCSQSGHPRGDWQQPTGRQHLQSRQHPKGWQPGPSTLPNPTLAASLQIKILDPDGVLEEALAMFKKTEEED